ncbi:DUF4180 domain-containing protein [Paenibacillus sp. FSL R7-0163]|uniref:DUF4180 domain-containing protein n=1 Tax=Paenibacillus TaxID=44249 RepID=UPI0004F8003E|nr:DUF4180 domain-containing protein [Paenibacillus odorifer]AIQ74898.1 cytoplasmic protein [Paenibacillus odorifer]OMD10877.1 cytoplasmic protein [Paenibacillus odorifer]
MKITVDDKNDSTVAIISGEEIIINNVRDALDLMMNVKYQGCDKMLLRKEQITDDFFELKSGIAGEIAQKYTNYQMRVAIVGEFTSYNSKSLNDFFYECNQGDKMLFKSTEAEALAALHLCKSWR